MVILNLQIGNYVIKVRCKICIT